MLRLWPDQLGVALFPDRLVLARASRRWWKRRLMHKEIISVERAHPDAPPWQAALDALAGKVAAGTLTGAQVTVVLSNSFVHYAVVPWSDALGSEEEEMALARHCFVRVYDPEADGWILRLSAKAPGKTRLACAVPPALIDALDKVMAPLGSRYCSLQPHLMASFNRWAAGLAEKPYWFAAAERGLLCLGLVSDGQWRSVRTIKVGPDWLNELPAVLNREACLVDSRFECDDVMLFSPEGADTSTLDAGKWRITRLLPTLLPGMAAGIDAEYSIALGV